MASVARRRFSTVGSFIAALCVQATSVAQSSGASLGAMNPQSGTNMPVFEYGVSAGLGYSDNIQRTPNDEKGETYASVGLNLAYNEDSRLLFSDTAIDVAYLDYLQHTYSSEVVGNANINLDARIVPGKFEWLLQDNFGQIRSDPFAPSTPDNRENINYFTTGPQFNAHLSNTMRAQLTGEYSKITYQRSDNADNDLYGAKFALIRDLSSATNVSLDLSSERTRYKDAVVAGADYDTRKAYIDFALKGARTKAAIDLGYTQVERGGEKSGGALVRVQVQRQLTPSSVLALAGGREVTSSGDVFRSVQNAQPVNLDTQLVAQSIDPIVRKYAQIGWDFFRARTGLGFNAGWSDESHQTQTTLNRRSATASAYVSRAIAPSLKARLSVSYTKENYYMVSADSKELSEALGLVWQAGRLLSTSLQIQHYSRASDVAGTDYKENRAWLQLIYGNARAL